MPRQGTMSTGVVVVRARSGRLAAAASELRRELARTFPTAEPPSVRTVENKLEPELRPWRLGAILFSIFGVLALVVAAVGVYSVMAYSVSQRARDMGIRLALGASGRDILQLVLGEGLRPLLAGVVLGVALVLTLGGFISAMLYATKPSDPRVLASVCSVLLVTGVVGSLVPAWRATRVDPAATLRAE
jgi:ABC-type antimicrobial peptide transport system permease subunit